MQYALLFLEGVITFISPCLLPMLPVYVSYFAAGEENRKKTLFNAVGFVLGFTAVFVLLGAFAGAAGGLLVKYSAAVNLIAGAVVVVLGLNLLGILKIGLLNRVSGKNANTQNHGFFASLAFGAVFSIGWTPCVGAFLGSALMMASLGGGAGQGVRMLLVYSLGLGIPFVVSALLIDRLKGAFGWIKLHYKAINAVCGWLLVAVGVLMATGLMGRLLSLAAV